MKCPHCNQIHDYDAVFCPNTGKQIFAHKQTTCSNKVCARKNVELPPSYKYCPGCGNKTMTTHIYSASSFRSTPIAIGELKCPYCGNNHALNDNYCPITGKKLQLVSVCPANHAVPYGAKFCPKCGSSKITMSFKEVNEEKNNTELSKPSISDSELILLRIISIIVGIAGLGTAILNWADVIETNKVFGIFSVATCGFICKLINDHCEKCGKSLF